MKTLNRILLSLAFTASALAGCSSTARGPHDNFGKIDDYKKHWDSIQHDGWALNTIKPINGKTLNAPGVPRVYIIADGSESLRGYAWALYRDPDAWMYFKTENPELESYHPDDGLPVGTKIPAQMLEWQILGFEELYGRKIIPQDSSNAEFFKQLKGK